MSENKQMPRREFIRKSVSASGGAFIGMSVGGKVPLPQLTNRLMPAQAASGRKGNNGVGNGLDPQPPGKPPINDGPGTGPGNPGNRGGSAV